MVDRVYIWEEHVVAMTLKPDYHLVLGHKTNGSTEYSVDPFLAPMLAIYTHGWS
jgi:hypothetical protein